MSERKRSHQALAGATLALCLQPPPASAADPQSLSSFVPVQTQDALVVPYGRMEFQGYALYTHDQFNKAGPALLQLNPTVKIAPLHHVQIDLSAPYNVGNQSTASQGNGSFNAYYQFTDPSPRFPALAVQSGYQFAEYGPGHLSNQYFVRGLATQWLGGSDKAPRLHLNVNWTHVVTPAPNNRSDMLGFGVAYSQLVRSDTALVLDVVHGPKPEKRQAETIVDIGLRHTIGDAWAIGGSIGAGLGQQSPGFRILFAIQRDFVLF